MQVPGAPVKDYLTQSGIFQLCAFALAYATIVVWRAGRQWAALALAGLALLFLANVLYVASGRTALVLMPVFVLLLGQRLFGWRGLAVACVAGALLGGIVWASSEYMRIRLTTLFEEAAQDPTADMQTSTGQRLEFYRKSADIILQAPIIGHGTGTIHARFFEASAGHSGAAGVATKNPHQQTFAIAIQLGLVGVAVLWAMWAAQLRLFVGEGMVAWFGLLTVLQNILSSLFNSHLFDFTQGWIYVFGVGVIGGMVLHGRSQDKEPPPFADGRTAPEQ
jgi:O-antigen ligase